MKPIAIMQHCREVPPGYFIEHLECRNIPWVHVRAEDMPTLRPRIQAYSGLCLLGGPMSVHDPLPWIEPELTLIRQAISQDVPVIGHCLGGQLLARALGARVRPHRWKEIGWGRVFATDSPHAQTWLGPVRHFEAYQWHGECFDVPINAHLILQGEVCTHQAFVLGKHLGMQFHIEITEPSMRDWNARWHDELTLHERTQPSVSTPAQQYAQVQQNLPAMRAVAARIYDKWLEGVAR